MTTDQREQDESSFSLIEKDDKQGEEKMLQYLPLVFCMLVCPVGMGLMMWMGTRTGQGSSQPVRPAKESQPLPAAEHPQERQTQEDTSPMSMIASCMKYCLNWKVLAGLAAVALVIAVVAPGLLSAALPTLLVLICPLSMVLMLLAMGFSKRKRGQNTASCCTQNAVPSSEVAPEPMIEIPRFERAERDPVKY